MKCIKCGGENIITTLAGIINVGVEPIPDTNEASCQDCGLRGIADDFGAEKIYPKGWHKKTPQMSIMSLRNKFKYPEDYQTLGLASFSAEYVNKLKYDNLENQLVLAKEDLECVHMFLDKMGAPRQKPSFEDGCKGEMRDLSIVGRIKSIYHCECGKPHLAICSGNCDNDE